MTMIRDIMFRVTKSPMEIAAAMAAGVIAPRLMGGQSMVPLFYIPSMAGAATYFFMDDVQDTASMVIGGVAGHAGAMAYYR